MPNVLLTTNSLTKVFQTGSGWLGKRRMLHAVRNVSLEILEGEALGLVGESGSGKTTLGRMIIRLIEPTSGNIRFAGIDLLALSGSDLRKLRRRFQIVFQDPSGALNPRMRVGDAVREPIEVHRLAKGSEATDLVRQLFNEVGLDADLLQQYPHQLSGGQKQRVGIARALAVNPDFLVLDEPVSALDVSVQAQVLNLLRDIRANRSLTYLFIAHDLGVVRHVADRVAVMYAGEIVEHARTKELFDQPHHPYTQALLASVPTPNPKTQRTHTAPGETPSRIDVPQGCPFAPRCQHPKKDATCIATPPTLKPKAPGHMVACHHA